jgi:hypothetical protein
MISPQQLLTYVDATLVIALLFYIALLLLLYCSSPLSRPRSFWFGLLFIATASLATAAYYIILSRATAPGVPADQLASALLLGAHTQTALVIVGLIGGGVGGNLIASALTAP